MCRRTAEPPLREDHREPAPEASQSHCTAAAAIRIAAAAAAPGAVTSRTPSCAWMPRGPGVSGPSLRPRSPAREVGQRLRRTRDVVAGRQQLPRAVPRALDQLAVRAIRHGDREAGVAGGDASSGQIEDELEPGLSFTAAHQCGDRLGVGGDARNAERLAVAGENLRERLPDDRLDSAAPPHDRLRRVLARRAAPEVAVHQQDARRPEARIVERVHLPSSLRLRAVVLERGRAEALEDHALQEAGGDDPIGVDVMTADRDRRAVDPRPCGAVHAQASSLEIPKSSRASVTSPAMAAAATITGDIRSVRPVGDPWRPLKFRFDDEAQSWLPSSLSGFMARHMEQPASRKSNPASRRIRSQPRRISSSRTRCDPGTTSAFTCGATWKSCPWTWRTTASKSDTRPFVHEPMKATSIFVPRSGLPGSSCMY